MPENQPSWLKTFLAGLAAITAVAAAFASPSLQPFFENVFSKEEASEDQTQSQKIVIVVRDGNTQEVISNVFVELETTIGNNKEGYTGSDGVFLSEIPQQETIKVYLRKEGYLDRTRSIDLRYHKADEKYTSYLLPEGGDATSNEDIPNIDGGNSSLDRPEIGIGDGPPVEPESNQEGVNQSFLVTEDLFDIYDAASKIDDWLNSKSKIFAYPYDENLARTLMTGQMLEENLGSINWLETYGWNYLYNDSMVVRESDGNPIHSDSFVVNHDEGTAAMVVKVYENRTLLKKNGSRCEKQSGESTEDFLYTFSLEPEPPNWKISFFCRIDQYHNCLKSETGC
ncbi:MAG: DUF4101 domain-containing protein [Tildeniella torsiva UHER 1998/13D]|jgi:hypothetical protein|nr:DUF4101 domain-containing protein [Tildeniella torsiva UHER 1998/13D]